jgi:hypothetical protein
LKEDDMAKTDPTPAEIEAVTKKLTSEFTERDWHVFTHVWYWETFKVVTNDHGLKGKRAHEETASLLKQFQAQQGWSVRDNRVLAERGIKPAFEEPVARAKSLREFNAERG